MKIGTIEELKTVQSMLGTLQFEINREVKDLSLARKMAAQKIGETYDPPISAEELESEIGKARATFYSVKRIAAIKNSHLFRQEANKPNADDSSKATYTQLYRQWCNENKHVASDAELAHFTGAVPGAFAYCRKSLISDGYIFEKNHNGWNVTCPVIVERTYTEKEVRTMMEDLLNKFGK